MKSRSLIMLAAGAAFFAGANVASAATFDYGSYSAVNGQDVTITSPVFVTGDAGEIKLTGTGANAGQTILAWCLDIYDDLQNSNIYNITSPLTTAGSGGSNPTALTALQIAEIGGLMAYGEANINTTNVSAAIQLAIWEIEYGSALHFVPTGFSSLAATFVNDVEGKTSTPIALDSNVSLLSESTGEGRDTRYDQSLGFLTPTPLPSTWVMMLSSLLGFGFLAFRRQKKNEAMGAA